MKYHDAAYRKATKTVAKAAMLIAAPTTLFTVTGVVEVIILGIIKTAVDSSGGLTLEVGIAGNTAALIAQAGKAALLVNTVWVDATPGNPQALPASQVLANGADIIQTTGTANADLTGEIDYICLWKPLSAGANLVAA
jgi:hypothetical protein